MGRLRKVVAWLLCLVMLSSAVACTGEKSASGQKVSGVKTPQQNSLLTHGKHREKAVAVRDGAPGNIVLENNALSDIGEAVAAGKTPEQKAEEHVLAENERYMKENCAGMSAEACSVQMYKQRIEALKNTASFGADFVPVVGDIKSVAEAQSALDYLVAAIGIIPGAGDVAGKAIKGVETALKKGDLAEASRLINKASDDVTSVNYFGQERKYWSSDPIQFDGNKVYQRNDLFDPQQVSSWKVKGKTVTGTNIERMASGRAPIGTDGKSVNLHHMTQKQDGPIAEVTQSFHKENSAVIHINPKTIPSGINRAAFDKWKNQYWQQRAKNYGE
jgi:roadblock/LC7 domain-containing protein